MTEEETVTDSELPQDPPGWGIHLTDDGQWLPVTWDGKTPIEPQPTKQAAVEAIAEHTGDPHVLDQADPAPNAGEDPAAD